MSLEPIALARTLPRQLLRFFAHNPPTLIASQNANLPPSAQATTPPSTSPPTAPAARKYLNPFLPHLHPTTKKWHPPIYSLRRQASLIKLAAQHGVHSLLPFSRKAPAERARKREEAGLRVKGTGEGQKVKGKKWERNLEGRQDKRRRAMLGMGALVREWKLRGHGRGFKKFPK